MIAWVNMRPARRAIASIRPACCCGLTRTWIECIWIGVSARKVLAIMVSPTSKPKTADWSGPRLDHAEHAARLAARRAEVDLGEPPRKGGTNRTASKRALLKAIGESGGIW